MLLQSQARVSTPRVVPLARWLLHVVPGVPDHQGHQLRMRGFVAPKLARKDVHSNATPLRMEHVWLYDLVWQRAA